jgi:hypothetical protein
MEMKSESFCYWLQGYFEILGKSESLSLGQVECIKRHLNMVFYHDIDPKMGNKEQQEKLNEIHSPGPNDLFSPYSPDGNTHFCPAPTLISC